MRRRRRMRSLRSSSGGGGRRSLLLPVIGLVVLIAGFVYLVRVADSVDPPQEEIRVAVPDAFDRSN